MTPAGRCGCGLGLAVIAANAIAVRPVSPQMPAMQGHVSTMSAPSAAELHVTREHGDIVLDLGPIDLPAHAMHDMVRQPPPLAVAVPYDGWIHGYSVEIVDSAGHEAPHRVLHHLNVIAPQKRELFSQIMLRVAAAGAETSPVSMPRVVGYRVHPGDTLVVSAMVHNPTDRAYPGAHVRVRMPFTSASSWLGALSIDPFYLDVMPPAGSHSFDVPPGRSEHSWEGSPAIAGRILGVSGHLHKYGVELRLEDRTEGRVLWRATPDTDASGDVTGMPITKFLRSFGIAIRPDHVYRLTAVYENPTGAPIVDGGMGALGGVFLPAWSVPWPAVDRSSAEFALDERLVWRLGGEPEHVQHP